MKINWKVRFKNPVFVIGKFIPFLILSAQALLALIGIYIPIGYEITDAMYNDSLRYLNIISVALLTLSAPIDDTTQGISDSAQSMRYTNPRKD